MSRAQRTTRPKKLGPKVSVQIFREDQVDSLIDYDSQRAAIETGVEKAEESVCCPCFCPSRRQSFILLSTSQPPSHHFLGTN